MNPDAKVTLYGGGAIGVGLYALGSATEPIIGVTGLGLIGATLCVSALFDHAAPE